MSTEEIEQPRHDVMLELTQVVCPAHGEIFRAQWPKYFGKFAVSLLQEALSSDDLHKALGGDVKRVPEICGRVPLCEWVPLETLEKLILECGVCVRGRCQVCRQSSVGGAFLTHERNFKHVCLNCILHNFRST